MEIHWTVLHKVLISALLINYMGIANYGVLAQEVFVSNLDSRCLSCLCYAASNCNMGTGCSEGHCGAFQLSHNYWIDAGRPSLFRDNPDSVVAFENCALTFFCAQGTVKHYLARYGKDCNGDGVTDCDDYAMMNYNGAFECGTPLNRERAGVLYWQRYLNCGK